MNMNKVVLVILRRCLMMVILADLSIARKPSGVFDKGNKSNAPIPRVVKGWSDLNDEYPFVVALMRESPQETNMYIRACSGSLLTSQFVITAGHCLSPSIKLIRCGNMSLPWNETQCKSNTLKLIHQPSTVVAGNVIPLSDIGVILVEKLEMKSYGVLHSADYKTFTGRAVKYAGFGLMFAYRKHKPIPNKAELERYETAPLQIGEGVIFSDESKCRYMSRPSLLVASKCSKREQHAYFGDSGGPLFLEGKIIGVVAGGHPMYIFNMHNHPGLAAFTPISPFLTWTKLVIDTFKTKLRKKIR